ncbi:LOW QUALITY PROTEIN: clavesin-2-like [Arctopsyche grandis]|uniref:LOW QUALITY PROTEIN: clavesin-2-like n=1 Tax=Arctopsyche grandis TaxID=121162 RepID=UPI00406D76BE
MAEFLEYDWNRFSKDHIVLDNRRLNKKKDSSDRLSALHSLKDSVGASMDLALRDKSKCQDDNFLEMFLYARKHDVQEAFQLLINYYSYRQRNADLFKNLTVNDEGVAHALEDGLPGVLAERDRRGRCVLIMFASNWNPALYTLTSVYRALLITLEKALEDVHNQANGFVIVVDWTEFSFKQSSNMNPKMLKLMIEGLQDCFPARFKGIHFIAQPWYVETALTVIKPFLKGKTKERIHLHGYNLSTLHEYVTKDILPSDLGGEGPSHNTEDWLAKLQCRNSSSNSSSISSLQSSLAKESEVEKAKIDRGYKKSEFSFLNNNGIEKSLKAELLNGEDELI